ncbi:helix-turn-helix transcriptional regulator [Chitinophaga sp.]|uniref:helix-turn-helix transcriptional regulator n=1 Tax=Chitinophaga sp. TaxID=1869181 RepID=UPI0025BDFF68|nr:helix-turn-helix transcriptional regulator [Chitinophaga sp.]
MKMERHLPIAALKPFVKAFLIIESSDGVENSTLPDTSVVMSFRFSGSVARVTPTLTDTLPGAGLSGMRKSVRQWKYARDTGNLLVLFEEGGAAAFFKTPLHELFEAQQPLEDLIRLQQIREVEEQLAEAGSHAQRIAVVETFLLSVLSMQTPDMLVRHAVAQIKNNQGNIKMKQLAAELFISQDAFEKRFRRHIGCTPKQFAAIVRLRQLIDHFDGTESLTDAAHKAGYFDQAHFIKDFKAFTGQTPQVFFQHTNWW